MKKKVTIVPLSPAVLAGLVALHVAIVLAFFSPCLAAITLIILIVLTGAAPFLVRVSYFLPVVSRGRSGRREVALTFDDGPDPAVTPGLLDLLDRYSMPAAFFVVGEKAEGYPDIISDILERGHEIGSHSWSHDVFLMLRGKDRLYRDIEKGREALTGHGIYPLAFRPPVGITNPRLWGVLLRLGMYCVNFTARAGDFGNRRVDGIARRLLRKVRPGHIVLLHDVEPKGDLTPRAWLDEVDRLAAGLKEKGLEPVPLSRLIGKPVMKTAEYTAGPVPNFYDGLALRYEQEQDTAAGRGERRAVMDRLPSILKKEHRVLEIGAGSGVFTLPMARLCGRVTALDISAGMLDKLKEKAGIDNVTNIRTIIADFQDAELDETYDAVCSFSSFEYIPDLEGLFLKISAHLMPGGILYFTTAHRSFFRFFTQLGNAVRQGIWLHARGRRQVRRALERAGFKQVDIQTRVLKSFLTRGMLMEVLAVKGDSV